MKEIEEVRKFGVVKIREVKLWWWFGRERVERFEKRVTAIVEGSLISETLSLSLDR